MRFIGKRLGLPPCHCTSLLFAISSLLAPLLLCENGAVAAEYTYTVDLVKDIQPGIVSSNLVGFVKFQDKVSADGSVLSSKQFFMFTQEVPTLVQIVQQVFFTAYNNDQGEAIWASDGTTEGTEMVKQIPSGIAFPDEEQLNSLQWRINYALDKHVSNDKIYFSAETTETGKEVWVSDGSSSGTQLLKDIIPGPYSCYYRGMPRSYVPFGGKTYFLICTDPNNYSPRLWATDGSESGTQPIEPSLIDSNIDNLVALSDRLVIRSSDSSLWYSDGTRGGTTENSDLSFKVGSISAPYNDQIFMWVKGSGNYFQDLWVTEGPQKTPKFVMSLSETDTFSYGFQSDTPLPNGKMLFMTGKYSASDSQYTFVLWGTDGSAAGTSTFFEQTYSEPFSTPKFFIYLEPVNKTFFFTASALWETDGSSTAIVKQFDSGSFGKVMSESYSSAGFFLLFVNNGGNNNVVEVWASDGTTEGTKSLAMNNKLPSWYTFGATPENPDAASDPDNLYYDATTLNDHTILFEGEFGPYGRELFKVTRTLTDTLAPTPAPTPAPSSPTSPTNPDTCSDSTNNFWAEKPGENGWRKEKTCDGWVKRKSVAWRCYKVGGVKTNCPKTCTNCCEDTTEPFALLFNNKTKTCDWARANPSVRCKKPPTRQLCAVICGECD